MTGLLLAGLLLSQTPAPPVTAPAAAPTLSELHAAQVDAHLSKVRALQAEIQLQQLALSQQREKINAVLALTYPGFRLDWDTGALVPVPATPPKETPP